MNAFVKVTATKSVNANRIIQALLLPIVSPDALGYVLSDGKWRDANGIAFNPLNHEDVAVAVEDEDYIDGLKVEYKLTQGKARHATVEEWVSYDIFNGDNRLLIIELENDCIVDAVDMHHIKTLDDTSFEVQRLKTFGFIE